MKAGRPPNEQRQAWALRYGIGTIRSLRQLTTPLMCQLSCCKSDECRRLILGKSS